MVFSSTSFLFVFLPLLLIAYYLPIGKKAESSRRAWRNGVLLLFSIGFYAWSEPVFVFVMLAMVAINWLLTLQMEKSGRHKKAYLAVTIAIDVALLIVCKYAGFLTQNIAALTGNDMLVFSVVLPVGISFFTFQMMSYVFDVYYGNAKAQRNILHVALYITLFPQLIAGPIVRYREVEGEITQRQENMDGFAEGVRRFISGLGKKVLLANFLAQIADHVFDELTSPSVAMAWLGAIAYTMQIYFDFSGYSDMAIGLGRMFGFHFPENFDHPYMERTATGFWRKWHMSLTTWFRDYIYIPLGGNRAGKAKWVRNLLIVWLLTGIWHGANWTFIVWGLAWFVLQLLEKVTGWDKKAGWTGHILTMLAVVLLWVVFRADDLTQACGYIGRMFGIGANGLFGGAVWIYLKESYVVLIMGIIGCTPLVGRLFARLKQSKMAWIREAWLLIVLAASILELISATYNPFIYFNF